MDTNTFLDAISDLGFALDKIEVIENSVELTDEESERIELARNKVDDAMKILKELFPKIETLDAESRKVLENELL